MNPRLHASLNALGHNGEKYGWVMRALGLRLLAVSFCAFFACGAPAWAQQPDADWVARGERLAHFIEAGGMVVTDRVRADQQQRAARLHGQAKLQALYDLAADDFISSDAERGVASLAALELEAGVQRSARYSAMAAILRAYGPALTGDYVAARSNLTQALDGESDAYVRAAGERLLAYALSDLGLVGNALEAARSGLVHLPDNAATLSLRSGLHDAMSYNAIKIGDFDSAITHLQRTVELETAAGRPIDGIVVVNNVVSMLAQSGNTDAALRLLEVHRQMAQHSASPVNLFFADLLCARVNFSARNFMRALTCANNGRANAEAPPEYAPSLLTFRLHALARLGRGREARQALQELRALALSRRDPSLNERLDAIEPEVLRAEGRTAEAFAAMRNVYENAQHNTMTRFNDGVKELRATLESEVAQAEEHAAAEAVRSELQTRTLEKMTLAGLLGGACLVGAVGFAWLIYRSRRDMLRAVGRAEQVLSRRGGATSEADASASSKAGAQHQQRLSNILDEIERRDSELSLAFRQLEAARAAAEEANVAKSQFLATMSHELRTPLNAIIGYSELLMEVGAEKGAAAEGQRDLERIRGAGTRLLSMINDVLDLSKIEAGGLVAMVQPVAVAGLMDEAAATVAPAAAANGNRVLVEGAELLGDAETDGFKLGQCLLNLMSNAAKFTRGGDIILRARRERCEDGDWLVFDVADTGIGISPEAQARLFQPFVQADATTTRAYGGTGLGLAITRRLAQLLGGDVSIKSALGEGSVFTLRVPARLPEAALALAAA